MRLFLREKVVLVAWPKLQSIITGEILCGIKSWHGRARFGVLVGDWVHFWWTRRNRGQCSESRLWLFPRLPSSVNGFHCEKNMNYGFSLASPKCACRIAHCVSQATGHKRQTMMEHGWRQPVASPHKALKQGGVGVCVVISWAWTFWDCHTCQIPNMTFWKSVLEECQWSQKYGSDVTHWTLMVLHWAFAFRKISVHFLRRMWPFLWRVGFTGKRTVMSRTTEFSAFKRTEAKKHPVWTKKTLLFPGCIAGIVRVIGSMSVAIQTVARHLWAPISPSCGPICTLRRSTWLQDMFHWELWKWLQNIFIIVASVRLHQK